MVRQVSVFPPEWTPTEPGERPPLNEERLSPEEAARVGAYLDSAAVVMHTTARGIDILNDDAPVVPLTIRTDGVFVWTGPVTYYVQTYGVAPDAEFLAHVRACDYVARKPTDDEITAATAIFA